MEPLKLTDGRLFCPACGKRECDEGDTDQGVTDWECPHCHTPFSVPAGTVLLRCKDGCIYSRSMNQPYPRHCIKCGQIEEIKPVKKLPMRNRSYLDDALVGGDLCP